MTRPLLAFVFVACGSRSTEDLAPVVDGGEAGADARDSCCPVVGRRADLTSECIEAAPIQHLGCASGLNRSSCVRVDTAGCIMRRKDGATPVEVYWTPSESHLDRLEGFEPCDEALRERVSVYFRDCASD